MNPVVRALSIGLFALLTSAAMAQSESAADPHQHCLGLCAQFYGADTDKRVLCESGCSDAKNCMQRCAERFGGDEDKRARCQARCTRARGK